MKRLGLTLGVLLACGWALAPVLWQVVTSLRPTAELDGMTTLLPATLTLTHYQAIMAGHPFGRLMVNSLLVAGGTTLIAVAFGSLAGFALTCLRPAGARGLLAAAVMLSMMPPVAMVSPLFLVVNALGLRDTKTALVLVYASFSLPLALWLMAQFFRSIPKEIYIAARVDGCSAMGAFRKVMLPLALPGIVATSLLVFIFAWNEFLLALSLTSSNASRTVPVGIALFPGLHEVPWGEIAAGSVVSILPVLALAVVFQRRLLEGLMVGAVKG